MIPTHSELDSATKPGVSVHAWNHFLMIWGVVECQNIGETNYLRRCDFFKWELKIINHFYTKMAKKGRDGNFRVRFLIYNSGKIDSIFKNYMSSEN